MMEICSKMMTHHFVMTSSLRIKIFKFGTFCDFSFDINYNSRTKYLGMLSPLLLIYITPGVQRPPQKDTKCLPATQRKQTKRACYLLKFYAAIII